MENIFIIIKVFFMIEREIYLNKLISFKDKQLIKVITGIRRCGKSTMFKLFQNYLLSTGVDNKQIININFEDADFEELMNYKKLYEYLKGHLVSNKTTYIFLDEIQNVENFQKTVDGLYIKDNVDIYITGSNARMLSGELATLLSGRYVQIKMLPLSFKEFVSFDKNDTNIDIKFRKYMKEGGFPYLLNLPDEQAKRAYLEGIYNTIIVKDIMARGKFSDSSVLQNIIKFMFDNIGNMTSVKKISDTLTSYGRKISVPTVENYLEALENSYILTKVNRYDISGRQLLKTQGKYYVTDLGLRQFILNSGKQNFGHNLENIVYLELVRRGCRVYIGKTGNTEVDFTAEKDSYTCYYQVSQTVLDENTLERELRPLNMIKDHNMKYILTMDNTPEISHNGIRQINVIDWLLN